MHRRFASHLSAAVILGLMLTAPIAEAKGDKEGKHGKGRKSDVVRIDVDGHRRIVTQYYSRESLPPGLAKRDRLPPGLAKQLRERGHLPPGLQKKLTPVPAPLVVLLPPVPRYETRYFAGRDLLIINSRSGLIVTIIRDVLP